MKINWYRLLFLILVGLVVLVGLEAIGINPIIKYLTVIALLYALQGDDPIITNKDQDE